MKKIIFFAQEIHAPWIEGVKNNAFAICKELVGKADISIISHNSLSPLTKKDTIETVPVHYLLRISHNFMKQLYYSLCDTIKVIGYIKQQKPEKIFVQYLDTTYIFSLLCTKVFFPKVPIYLTVYSTDELSIGYKKLFLRLFSFKKIIIITDFLREKVEQFGYEKQDVVMIPLSFDKQRYLYDTPLSSRKQKTILFSAGPMKEAGSFFVVDLAEKMPEYTFLLAIRKFDEKSELQFQQLQDYVLQKSVQNIAFHRNVDQMEQLLSSVSALILPLQDMRIKMLVPIAMLEALARATPVFASNLPNMQELVSPEKGVILFPRTQVDDCKSKIEKYINDFEISQNAYNFAAAYPSYQDIGQKYYELISE